MTDEQLVSMSQLLSAVSFEAMNAEANGRMDERAAIVAWLRSDRIVVSMDGSAEDVIASAIEAGEHLK